LDELRFYSRALSAAEVEQRYQIGNALKVIVSATGSGSFGRNFNISAATSSGSFNSQSILSSDLTAGSLGSVNLQNISGVPATVSVRSNSCNVAMPAAKALLGGVWC
jgi:hypothetical protein